MTLQMQSAENMTRWLQYCNYYVFQAMHGSFIITALANNTLAPNPQMPTILQDLLCCSDSSFLHHFESSTLKANLAFLCQPLYFPSDDKDETVPPPLTETN